MSYSNLKILRSQFFLTHPVFSVGPKKTWTYGPHQCNKFNGEEKNGEWTKAEEGDMM